MPYDDLPERFVRRLLPAVEQAAAIAIALEGQVANRPKVGEVSVAKAALTTADIAAQEALLVPLLAEFRSAQLEAEEDTPSAQLFRGEAAGLRIVIDPIDGTWRCYLRGEGPYAVMAGLAVDDRYRAALVALPREGLLASARLGGPVETRRLGARASAPEREPSPPPPLPPPRIFVSDTVPEAVRATLRARGYAVCLASGGATAIAPLVPGVVAGLRFAPAAAGGTISPRGRIGVLIARACGAVVQQVDGAPFPEALDAPVASLLVARDAGLAAELAARIGPAAPVPTF